MQKTSIRSRYDDLDISVMWAEPQGEPKAVLQLAHGMVEHKERYVPFMEFMTQNGYACVIHDHRGHGESIKGEDTLGFMFEGGWNGLVEDVKTVMDWAKKRFPQKPVYLFGHSMGSMVVRSFTKRYDSEIEGLIVCGSPSDNAAKGIGKLLASIVGALRGEKYQSELMRSLALGPYDKPFSSEGPNAWLSVNRANVDAYDADPLCRFCFTANGFKNLFGLMQDCYSKKAWAMNKPKLPIHFISGGDDPCRIDDKSFYKAVEFMRQRGYSNVSSRLYENLRHEILNEDCAAEIYKDILDFLQK